MSETEVKKVEPEDEEEEEEDLEKLQAEIERMEAEAARITKETEALENGGTTISTSSKKGEETKEEIAKRDG